MCWSLDIQFSILWLKYRKEKVWKESVLLNSLFLANQKQNDIYKTILLLIQ